MLVSVVILHRATDCNIYGHVPRQIVADFSSGKCAWNGIVLCRISSM